MKNSKFHKFKANFSLFLLAGVGCISLSQLRMLNRLKTELHKTPSTEIRSQLASAKVLELTTIAKSPTFGFRNTLANWTFLDFLQYFGDNQSRDIEGYELTGNFFESIITHDPYYRDFYLFLSGSGSLYAANPKESVSLMQKGLDQLSPNEPSDSHYIWRYKGVDELLFLGDGKNAQRSFRMAADWAAESKDPDSKILENLSRRTAQYLMLNPDSKAAQAGAWSSVIASALDDATRQHAVEQIEELGGSVSFSEDGGISIKFAQVEDEDSGG